MTRRFTPPWDIENNGACCTVRDFRGSMSASPNDVACAAAVDFARGTAALWQARLGTRLLGVYLIGSLAHGGFSRRYSDIDMAIVAEDGLGPFVRYLMHAEAAKLSRQLVPMLSFFWTNRHFSVGRFPLLDRVDFLDHAVPLVERERVLPLRPSLEETRTYLRRAPFTKWAEDAQRFVSFDALKPEDHKAYIRTLLYPARLIYSWTTGGVASNDDAVEFLYERRPVGLDVDLIRRALQCRRDETDPISLFPARAALSDQVNACARLLAS